MKKTIAFFLLLLFLNISAFALSYEESDLRAKTTPSQVETSLSKLVDYLIEPYKKNEELKARVIFAWIVYHIDYDGFKAAEMLGENNKKRKRFLSSGDVFDTRVGVCADMADLFLKMANRAGLKVERIEGYAGSNLTLENFESAPHAWNAVRIDNKWQFIDTTWGMSGDYVVFDKLKSAKAHKEEIKKRRQNKNGWPVNPKRALNGNWFLTPPEEMIKTHFPNSPKWQLLNKPIKVRDVFKENSQKSKEKEKTKKGK